MMVMSLDMMDVIGVNMSVKMNVLNVSMGFVMNAMVLIGY